MSFQLETCRLVLRELSFDDLDFVAEMLAHPEVMHFGRGLTRATRPAVDSPATAR